MKQKTKMGKVRGKNEIIELKNASNSAKLASFNGKIENESEPTFFIFPDGRIIRQVNFYTFFPVAVVWQVSVR